MNCFIAVYFTQQGHVVPIMRNDDLMAQWSTLEEALAEVSRMPIASAYEVVYFDTSEGL